MAAGSPSRVPVVLVRGLYKIYANDVGALPATFAALEQANRSLGHGCGTDESCRAAMCCEAAIRVQNMVASEFGLPYKNLRDTIFRMRTASCYVGDLRRRITSLNDAFSHLKHMSKPDYDILMADVRTAVENRKDGTPGATKNDNGGDRSGSNAAKGMPSREDSSSGTEGTQL
jgi:hypothetical protein